MNRGKWSVAGRHFLVALCGRACLRRGSKGSGPWLKAPAGSGVYGVGLSFVVAHVCWVVRVQEGFGPIGERGLATEHKRLATTFGCGQAYVLHTVASCVGLRGVRWMVRQRR